MQSSTDLCVTVQLYTQVSACCWLCRLVYGWRQQQQDKKNNLLKLEASLAPAEADVGAEAKADQKHLKNLVMDFLDICRAFTQNWNLDSLRNGQN